MKSDGKEPKTVSYTFEEVTNFSYENDELKLDNYITSFLKIMKQFYSNLYYFTKMNLVTLETVKKNKTDLYNHSELKTLVEILDTILYESEETDLRGKQINSYLYKTSGSSNTNSKVETLKRDINKEEYRE